MNISPKDILESTAWAELLDRVRLDLVGDFARSDAADTEQLQDVAYRLAALTDIVDTIEMVAREETAAANYATTKARGATSRSTVNF